MDKDAEQPKESAKDRPYSSDQPISCKDADRFNRWPFAKRIAETIVARKDTGSLVIGIYGVWGDGKTSALNLMEEALGVHEDIVIIKFNPWHFESQAQLVSSFFETLADALGKSLATRKEELGNILKRYGSILSLASFGLGGVVQVSPGGAVKDLGETLSTVELDELRGRLEKLLAETGKRVVVFIDDIDRLDRREVQAVFKLVKLSAGFERTVYVLAFDDELVAGALGEQYGTGNVQAGHDFLEKIVQVPLRLPPADDLALRKLCFEGVDAAVKLSEVQLTDRQVQTFIRHFVDGLEVRLATPRQAKRYANALSFALPILRGEVNPVDQMLLEGIRVFYPRLYLGIRDYPDVYLGSLRHCSDSQAAQKQRAEKIAEALSGLTPVEADAARKLLQALFPRVKGAFGNRHYGDEWDRKWEKEQRVCAAHYFPRFFSYAVPVHDVPDQELSLVINGLSEVGDDEAAKLVRAFAERGAAAILVKKLRSCAEEIPVPATEKLAKTLARVGGAFPRESGPFFSLSTFSQAAMLVSKLVERLPNDGSREELARQIIQEAEPLSFAAECLRWLQSGDDKPEEERRLSRDAENEVGRVLAERIKKADAEKFLCTEFDELCPTLYWIWHHYGNKGEVALSVHRRIQANPQEAVLFLTSFVGTAWGMESGLPTRSDFHREAYDMISKMVDADLILGVLRGIYDDTLGAGDYHGDGMPFERRVAHQFAFIHLKVLEERLKDASTPALESPPDGQPSTD